MKNFLIYGISSTVEYRDSAPLHFACTYLHKSISHLAYKRLFL